MTPEYVIDRDHCSEPEKCDDDCSHVWFTVKVIRGDFGDILAEFATRNEAETFAARRTTT